ncbi:MAG TPA: FtsK/SpoIIIE domain-containing protein, partial [Anaerolineales bacterium]|nr:FtsK/SpoIIIE domain-containing protein [Anaerolineales bacterium]
EKTVFRYTEVGLNSPRYIGEADMMSAADARQKYAARIRRLDIRRPFGSDLPRSVDMLQMQSVLESKRIDTVDKYTIKENWEWSMVPKNSEWLNVPIGMVSSREVRNLVFSAKEGGDGVHGMVAGTTGSGKSELLLTLIAGMAIKYDPRIVNFVLVDFKGGAAFEPFKKLPHVVDILTNLQASAVERMFVAVQAVMDQRSTLLARSNMKDLVDYRQKAPFTRDESLPKTFPHLFIIVDEFAEMITANPDYKAKFESITRLGRAFGVTLILATQRPAGVVTDQMRANMKFRICLRVETPDDSKELLGRPDAAFLANLGGRGYIQVGNDVLQASQIARAGGDYSDDRSEVVRDVIWLDEESLPSQSADGNAPLYTASELAEALGMKPGEKPGTLVDWIVGICALRAKRDGVPPQRKPWPDPLPVHLPLTEPVDALYLNTERTVGPEKTVIIDEEIKAWLNNTEEKPLWKPFDWKSPQPLRADIGIVDNPYLAEQRFLTIDLTTDPLVLFSSAGRGKTTFIKTLLLTLGASRTPDQLHMYALDFGRGGLKAIKALPHLGAVIDASETARVDQMLRMLRNFCNERQERLQNYASLFDHNARNPSQAFAEIVMVIDNFAEFKESYEHIIPELMALIRDGRSFGVYFVITASNPSDVSGKLYNLLTQRLTLTLPDRGLYADIVGRGAPNFDNVPGRGLMSLVVKDNPVPLEFQVGIPGLPPAEDQLDTVDEYQIISQRMEKVWFAMGGKRPSAELPRSLTLLDMFTLIDNRPINTIGDLQIAEKWKQSMVPEKQDWLRGAIGLVSSKEIRTMYFQAQADGVHGMAAGTTGSGKSELIQTLISAMAIRYDPRIVNFVLVDYKGGPTVEPFRKLPHAVDIATNLNGNAVERIFIAINAEMNRRSDILAKTGVSDLVEYRKKVIPGLKPDSPFPTTFPHLFIIVDEFAEMMTANPEYRGKFESITRLGRSFGVSLILATQRPAGVVSDQMRSNMKFRLCLRVETAEDSKELLKKPDAARLPQIGGRGYVQAGTDLLTEVQAAWSGAPYDGAKVNDPVYPADEILTVLEKKHDPPRSVLGWLVGALAAEAKRQGIPKQFKPWPDNLPEVLPMNTPVDASYLPELPEDKVVINPPAAAWANIDPTTDPKEWTKLWQPWSWEKALPLKAAFGIVDDPFHSNQRLLNLDIAGDPIVIFGASGRGKTTFLKSFLLALGARWSPNEMHIYALDFGRGGLKAIKVMPHCGATIDASQPERVGQLFRLVRSIMNERQEILSKYASWEDYNIQNKDNPERMFPAIIFVIDNFAEFKESYEALLGDLIAMVRDGRQFGIYYVITASHPSDLAPKLYNILTTRVCFTMSDPGTYIDIVGRGALSLANVPGRGLINIDGQPLEFHVSTPVLPNEKDSAIRLAERMEKAWFAIGGKRPAAEIPRAITLLEMYQTILGKKVERIGDLEITANWQKSLKPENQEWLSAPIGLISSKEVRTMIFSAKAGGDGVHGMAAGTTGSGKSELIQTLISALAIKYDPRIVNFVLVDYKGGPTVEPFRKLPHAVDIATNLQGNAVERIFIAIGAEMNRRSDVLAKAGVADLV